MKQILILFLFIFITEALFAQKTANCAKVELEVDTEAEYKSGAMDMMEITRKELYPIFEECMQNGDGIIGSLSAKLTIDNEGNVIDVVIIRLSATEECKEKVKQKMMSFTGWTPAIKGNEKVCSYYNWTIRCILPG